MSVHPMHWMKHCCFRPSLFISHRLNWTEVIWINPARIRTPVSGIKPWIFLSFFAQHVILWDVMHFMHKIKYISQYVYDYAAEQSQRIVTAYLKSKWFLPFDFPQQHMTIILIRDVVRVCGEFLIAIIYLESPSCGKQYTCTVTAHWER